MGLQPARYLSFATISVSPKLSRACFGPTFGAQRYRRLHRIGAANLVTMSSSSLAGAARALPYRPANLDHLPISTKVIGTHSGTFQADEAMGVFMLQQLPEYRNAKVVRSRDAAVLNTLDIVIDVGGVYNHDELRYDHHQRGYDERFDDGKPGTNGRCTKLSASGLVYRHYGRLLLLTHYPDLTPADLELSYVKIYNTLLESLDAIDTGVEQAPDGVTELVYTDATGLSRRVGRLNPRWNEMVDPVTGTAPDADLRFALAVQECGRDFVSVMTHIIESDLPARTLVEQALRDRHHTHATGEIVKLASGGLPWRNHLYELEKEHNVEPLIKFVLYQDVSGMWRVQAVTVEGKAFENRLSLPEEWRGVRDEDLAAVTKIPGSRFVHAAGFIGGADTYGGVLDMAREALTRSQ